MLPQEVVTRPDTANRYRGLLLLGRFLEVHDMPVNVHRISDAISERHMALRDVIAMIEERYVNPVGESSVENPFETRKREKPTSGDCIAP